jgi:ferric-dicitrate binding protein FerR (iron transport regulator)
VEDYYAYFDKEMYDPQLLSPEVQELLGEKIFTQLNERIQKETGHQAADLNVGTDDPASVPSVHRIHFLKTAWFRYTAASVILLLGSAAYFYFSGEPSTRQDMSAHQQIEIAAPKSNRATITLADGTPLHLDSVSNGQLTMQGSVKLVKVSNGQISYETTKGDDNNKTPYNTLTNPKGSQVIDMTLADGSRVWLNAGSSIRYPVAFTDNERKVDLTGEGYFEIAKNKDKPFRVMVNSTIVEVTGTKFNINGFADEPLLSTTLLEGGVKVSRGNQAVVLLPGQQSNIDNNGNITVKKGVNTDEIMSWKNGLFQFESGDLITILRQVARWYDVDITYEGITTQDRYFVLMQRSSSFAEVLDALQAHDLEFKLIGRRLTVRPANHK